LDKLQQQDKDQFDRVAEDLNTNRQVIIDAISENRLIAVTDLITKSSAEMIAEKAADLLWGLR
jgi:hypothetical protein